ncbi:MAG: universal stress protein [Desulfobacterales bacterium]
MRKTKTPPEKPKTRKTLDMGTYMPTNANYPKLEPVRNLLVCLDLTAIDTHLISYAAFMARMLPAAKVTFFHAIQAYDLPDRGNRSFPDIETELNSIIREEMHKSVDSHFEEECQWDIATQVGYEDASREIVDYIKENKIDLTLIGQKFGENREARYSRKIAAEASSDLLFVPQYAEKSIDPILCAIDFSPQSVRAFERTLDMSRTWGVEMNCYFVCDPTRAYFPATTERSASHYQQQAKRAYEQFLKDYELSPADMPCRIETGHELTSEAENIYQAAIDDNARLIVLGAQGDTANVTSLLGNLSESFRLMEKEIPVMVLKNPPRKKFFQFWK